nr:zinc finger A20 and AN1 domain-containing stress-associated protein 5 [Ipomoea batatas]
MAQKTGKEETEFKVVPETITLCVNNCGVTGNPATNNMCQKCFSASTAAAGSSSAAIHHKFGEKQPRSGFRRLSPERTSLDLKRREDRTVAIGEKTVEEEEEENRSPPAKREVNRCSGCRRKVGLTGFRCRCGELFCGEHRYSDRHDCSYDYKAAGRDAIARENPVVKAAKIVKGFQIIREESSARRRLNRPFRPVSGMGCVAKSDLALKYFLKRDFPSRRISVLESFAPLSESVGSAEEQGVVGGLDSPVGGSAASFNHRKLHPHEEILVDLIGDVLPLIKDFRGALIIPKLPPPPPLIAQNRSSPIDSLSRIFPFASTILASKTLSTARPYFLIMAPTAVKAEALFFGVKKASGNGTETPDVLEMHWYNFSFSDELSEKAAGVDSTSKNTERKTEFKVAIRLDLSVLCWRCGEFKIRVTTSEETNNSMNHSLPSANHGGRKRRYALFMPEKVIGIDLRLHLNQPMKVIFIIHLPPRASFHDRRVPALIGPQIEVSVIHIRLSGRTGHIGSHISVKFSDPINVTRRRVVVEGFPEREVLDFVDDAFPVGEGRGGFGDVGHHAAVGVPDH